MAKRVGRHSHMRRAWNRRSAPPLELAATAIAATVARSGRSARGGPRVVAGLQRPGHGRRHAVGRPRSVSADGPGRGHRQCPVHDLAAPHGRRRDHDRRMGDGPALRPRAPGAAASPRPHHARFAAVAPGDGLRRRPSRRRLRHLAGAPAGLRPGGVAAGLASWSSRSACRSPSGTPPRLWTTARRGPMAMAGHLIRGYPLAAVLGATTIFLIVLSLLLKTRAIQRGWEADHLPMIIKPGCYDAVATDLKAPCATRACRSVGRGRRGRSTVPPKLVVAVGGGVARHLVPSELADFSRRGPVDPAVPVGRGARGQEGARRARPRGHRDSPRPSLTCT